MDQQKSIQDNADLSMSSFNFVQSRVYEPDCRFSCLAKDVEEVEARKERRWNGEKELTEKSKDFR
jgi:hypothetical protein